MHKASIKAQRWYRAEVLTQDIDTTTAGGQLIFTVFSALAEFECVSRNPVIAWHCSQSEPRLSPPG